MPSDGIRVFNIREEAELIRIHLGVSLFIQPPLHYILCGSPLMVGLAIILADGKHFFKCPEVCLLVLRVPCELEAHLIRASQRAADTADAVEALIVELAVRNVPGVEIFPDFFLCPVDDGVEGVHTFHGTGFEHYADSHKGFCIGYDIKGENDNITHLTLPVLYKDHCTLQVSDLDDIDGSVCMHMLTEKSLAWRHEKEWRTFFPPNPPRHKEYMPLAKAVYLGARILPEHESRLKEICGRKQIRLYRMVPKISEYRLVAVAL